MHYYNCITLLYALPIRVGPLICTTYNSRTLLYTSYNSITLLYALPITVDPLICSTDNSSTHLYALPITVEPSDMHYL